MIEIINSLGGAVYSHEFYAHGNSGKWLLKHDLREKNTGTGGISRMRNMSTKFCEKISFLKIACSCDSQS